MSETKVSLEQAQAWIAQAKAALKAGRPAQAREWALRASAARPDLEEAWLTLAACSEPGEAIECLRRAQRLNPQSKRARAGLDWAERRATLQAKTQPRKLPARPQPKRRPRRAEWALWVGALLAGLTLLLVWLGPWLAPQDPLKETWIAKSVETQRYVKPPFEPGEVAGFPLGSDEFGRDVLSRLLWGLRPTMTLVLVTAGLRLAIGTAVGLLAGWSTRWPGRWMDGLISTALSAPAILAALLCIAAAGKAWGLWAFVAGLTITGWADTARMAQTQTRLVKSKPYVEAARAMGASGAEIIITHVAPQALPMIWIQLSLEVAASLLGLGALGFLGYFINAVWIPVGDFTALRASGAPELGQMLGTGVTGDQPWTALLAGTVIFVIVLAFNLLGEGLRQRFQPGRRRALAGDAQSTELGLWVQERVYGAAAAWQRTAALGALAAVLLAAIVGGGVSLWRDANALPEGQAVTVPGGHGWVGRGRDAQNTGWTPALGPATPPRVMWTYRPEGTQLVGGPAVAADGTVYVTSADARLLALNPQGALLWAATLPEAPAAGLTPGIDAQGNVVVVTANSGVAQVSPSGQVNWARAYGLPSESSPTAGPAIQPDGTLVFATRLHLLSVRPNGELLWKVDLPTYSVIDPTPRFSADWAYLFFEDTILDPASGATIFGQTQENMDRYIVGADSVVYLRTLEGLDEWRPTDDGAVLIQKLRVDVRSLALNVRIPAGGGVTPRRQVWLNYSSGNDAPRLVSSDLRGENSRVFDAPYLGGWLVGVDGANVAYLCGETQQRVGECQASSLTTGQTLWTQPFEAGLSGGALASDRLYLVSAEQGLLALGTVE